jgi:hypothetical protein
MPTQQQRQLIAELEELATMVSLDYWNIDDYPRHERTTRLQLTMRQIVISAVIKEYTFVDELLNMALCDYFFGRHKTYPRLWREKRFQYFNYYFLEQLYLLQKLRYVRAFLDVPRSIAHDIEDLNNLRNALAHAFFPENLKRHQPKFKGLNIFSLDGMRRFADDMRTVRRFFRRSLRLWQRGYTV